MLFENGRLAEALPHDRRALALQPTVALLHFETAQVEIELGDKALEHDALDHLREAPRIEPLNADAARGRWATAPSRLRQHICVTGGSPHARRDH